MGDNGGNRLMGIRQIVRLKELLQKWQKVTLGPRLSNPNSPIFHEYINHEHVGTGGINPTISKRLKTCSAYSDSDTEDGSQTPDLPHDVPKGYLAVYVGPELRRFIIPTTYLGDPLFSVLLQKAEEEFGFDHNGGLTILCEIETFKYLLKCIEHHHKDNQAESSSNAIEE